MELWEGPKDTKNGKNGKKGNVKVSQPISQNQSMNQSAMNQSLGTTSISSLPTGQPTQQFPDYNSMHQQDTTPLVGAATPGQEGFSDGPVAANAGGGGAFGSAFW
jgi:hypothetical protein